MTTLLLDCTHGSTKSGFAQAVRSLVPEPRELLPILDYVPQDAHAHDHHHHSIQEVHDAIQAAPVAEAVKEDARGVYAIIAAAEAKAHGVRAREVHFHEVGAPDAIAHIVAAFDALSRLSFDAIASTPVCTGFGFVDCAHGTLPIPAPATAHILESIPAFAGDEEGELTTPTGAALVAYFADRFLDADAGVQKPDGDVIIRCNP